MVTACNVALGTRLNTAVQGCGLLLWNSDPEDSSRGMPTVIDETSIVDRQDEGHPVSLTCTVKAGIVFGIYSLLQCKLCAKKVYTQSSVSGG